jgi:hypothetical protein
MVSLLTNGVSMVKVFDLKAEMVQARDLVARYRQVRDLVTHHPLVGETTVDNLIQEACERFGISRTDLQTVAQAERQYYQDSLGP